MVPENQLSRAHECWDLSRCFIIREVTFLGYKWDGFPAAPSGNAMSSENHRSELSYLSNLRLSLKCLRSGGRMVATASQVPHLL